METRIKLTPYQFELLLRLQNELDNIQRQHQIVREKQSLALQLVFDSNGMDPKDNALIDPQTRELVIDEPDDKSD